MKDFRKLKVWEKSHQLTLNIYRSTQIFLPKELYGLTGQMRRAALSITTNIAEGCWKGSDAELSRFLYMSMGSASELDSNLLLARDLHSLKMEESNTFHQQAIEVKRMFSTLIIRLKSRNRMPTAES